MLSYYRRPFVLDLCKIQREPHINSTVPVANSPELVPRLERRSSSKETPRKRKRYATPDDDSVELVGSQLQESRLHGKCTSTTSLATSSHNIPSVTYKLPAEMRVDDQPAGSQITRPLHFCFHVQPIVTTVVTCPICTRPVPFDFINQHMDQRCSELSIGESSTGRTSKVKQKQDWARLFHPGEPSGQSKSKGKEKCVTCFILTRHTIISQ